MRCRVPAAAPSMTAWNSAAAHEEATQDSMAAYRAACCLHWHSKSTPLQPMLMAPLIKHCCAQTGMAESATGVQASPVARALAAKSATSSWAVEIFMVSAEG